MKKDTRPDPPSAKYRVARSLALVSAAIGLVACAGSPSVLDTHSPEAARIEGLFLTLTLIASAVCLLVVVLIVVALVRRHPQAVGPRAGPVPARPLLTKGTHWIVGGGIVLPLVVLSVVFVMELGVLNATPTSASANDLTIEVIGHQWWWEVRYPQLGITTANEIHIPAGPAVAVRLTTADVIHSFWVPQIAPKLDLINGMTNTLVLNNVQPGQYRGQCAEFCGVQHALMGVLVVAEPAPAFDAWAQNQRQPAVAPSDNSAQAGEQVFLSQQCVYCHTVRGTRAAGQLGPDLTHVASRQTLAALTLLNTAGNLGGWVIDPQGLKPGNQMPHTDLAAPQLQQLLAYLESLK